jgi:hypothetical protein
LQGWTTEGARRDGRPFANADGERACTRPLSCAGKSLLVQQNVKTKNKKN